MPTPFAHSFTALSVLYTKRSFVAALKDWKMLLFYVFLANAPDLDFLPGIFINNPNLYHRGFTHSLVFAVVVGIIVGTLFHFVNRRGFVKWFLTAFGLVTLHLVLDYFTMDTAVPYGVPLFWPFVQESFIAPFSIFRDITKGDTTATLFLSFFSRYNFITFTIEILIFTFVLLVIKYVKKRTH